MRVERASVLDGSIRAMEIDITPARLHEIESSFLPIQVVAPELSDAEREFIMTGITDDEWDELFLNEDDYHDEPDLED
jgi:hypothetical protein